MRLLEKIAQINRAKTGKMGERLQTELKYAMRVSKQEEGRYDDLLDETAQYVIDNFTTEKFLTDNVASIAEEKLLPMQNAAKKYQLHCVSHAHIDMNWLWGFQETTNVVLDTLRTMLVLMDEYPQFTFSQSQASIYSICEEYDPELFELIKQKVQEGRWEVAATTWTEADKNLSSGESLTRHILYTKKYFAEKFGLSSGDLQLDLEPDTFGHSINVPEILKNGGIKFYYHCRGEVLEYMYRYRAPGGSEILCYQDPYFYVDSLNNDFIEFLPEIKAVRGTYTGIKVYGVGDHGGGPTRRDIENIINMQSLPIAPTILFSTYSAFFKELEKDIEMFPVIDTERNFVFTGCYSSQQRIKAANNLSQYRLYSAEALSAIAACYAGASKYTVNYKKAWLKVLFNQFHDILPGTNVRDSREYAMGEYQQALAYANAGLTKGMLALADNIDSSFITGEDDLLSTAEGAGAGFLSAVSDRTLHTAAEYGYGKTRVIHLFNTTRYKRTGPVEIIIWDWTGDEERLEVINEKSSALPFFIKENEVYWMHNYIKLFVVCEVEGFGYTTLIIREKDLADIPLSKPYVTHERRSEFPENILENDRIKACFDNNMCLVSLINKITGINMVTGEGGYFEFFEESSRIPMPNAWFEGNPVYSCNMNKEGKVFIMNRDLTNAVIKSITYTVEYRDSVVNVHVFLDTGSSLLRQSVKIEWREVGKHQSTIPSVRYKVPLSYTAEKYRYDIPMGTIVRGPLNHDAPAMSFVYAENPSGAGVGIFSDTINAFRGQGNHICATIIRATSWPDDYPEYGQHSNEIGLGIIENDVNSIFETSSAFTTPIPFISVRPHKGVLPMDGSYLKIMGSAVVSALKMPEERDGKEMIVRLYSIEDKTVECTLIFSLNIESAEIVDTLESFISVLTTDVNKVYVSIPKNRTISVRVKF